MLTVDELSTFICSQFFRRDDCYRWRMALLDQLWWV